MTIYRRDVFFSNFESACHSMSGSNCCFLTCIWVSQEAGQVVQYSHLLKNFPQFAVIYTVKGFGIVNKAELDFFFFWNSLAFSTIQQMLAIWSLVPLPFLKSSLNIWKFMVHILLKPGLENFEHYFASMWDDLLLFYFDLKIFYYFDLKVHNISEGT